MHYLSTRFSSSYHICCSLGCSLWHVKRQDLAFVLPKHFKEGKADWKGIYDVTVNNHDCNKWIRRSSHVKKEHSQQTSNVSHSLEGYEPIIVAKRPTFDDSSNGKEGLNTNLRVEFCTCFYVSTLRCGGNGLAIDRSPYNMSHQTNIQVLQDVMYRIRRHNVTRRRLNL